MATGRELGRKISREGFIPAMPVMLLLQLPPGPSVPRPLKKRMSMLPQHLATDYDNWAETHEFRQNIPHFVKVSLLTALDELIFCT